MLPVEPPGPIAPSSLCRDEPALADNATEQRLLDRVRRGSRSAVGELFTRYASWLRRFARGRLPRWARDGIDTSDLVQDALVRTFAHLSAIRSAHAGALRVYLRRTIENRIGDRLRRATLRHDPAEQHATSRPSDVSAPQFQQLLDDETWQRYLKGLKQLKPRHRRLVVGRIEFGYSHRQLAVLEGLPTPDAARMALRRALLRLSNFMPQR